MRVSGLRVLHEECHQIPVVDLDLWVRSGSAHDPVDRPGLTSLTWQMMRRGTRRLAASEVDEVLGRLGARLAIETHPSWVRVGTVVLRRNLEGLVELLSSLVRSPAFRAADLAELKRELSSRMQARRDDDRALAAAVYRRALFGSHPYGRSIAGTPGSLRRIRTKDLRRHFEEHLVPSNLLLSVSGAVTAPEIEALVDRHFRLGTSSRRPSLRLPRPRLPRGRRVVVVDKPDRVQSHTFVGTLGTSVGDEHYYPLHVANTAFGGMFSSPLMQEVREKRGWSYGASSTLSADRVRDAWTLWTAPEAVHVAACLSLQLELVGRFVESGPSRHQVAAARKYLINGHRLDQDTPMKRLAPRVDAELYSQPVRRFADYSHHVRRVQHASAVRAVQERLSSRDLVIALVATATDVVPQLERISGLTSVEVVPYRQV